MFKVNTNLRSVRTNFNPGFCNITVGKLKMAAAFPKYGNIDKIKEKSNTRKRNQRKKWNYFRLQLQCRIV